MREYNPFEEERKELQGFKDFVKGVFDSLKDTDKPIVINRLSINYCSGGGAKILIDSKDIED